MFTYFVASSLWKDRRKIALDIIVGTPVYLLFKEPVFEILCLTFL